MTLLLEGVNRDTHFAGLLVNSLTLGGQEVPHSLYTLAMKVRGCSCVHLSIDMRAKGTVCCAGACRSAPGLNASNQCCEGHHFCASCLQMQQVLNASSSICDCMEQQLLWCVPGCSCLCAASGVLGHTCCHVCCYCKPAFSRSNCC